jgi:hypothetical protein
MSNQSKKLEEVIAHLEHFVECWKQFNHYFGLARAKHFAQEDEDQFLEIKSVVTQELEWILNRIEGGLPSKEEVHNLIAAAPSIRFMSELNEGGLKALEAQWHKLFISWQSMLGQLKVQMEQLGGQSRWSFFGRKK